MDVIRHHHEGIQSRQGEMIGDGAPTKFDQLPGRVQPHLAVRHLAEQARPILRAGGDKVRPGLGIIMPFQPDAAAGVLRLGWFHGPRLFHDLPRGHPVGAAP
nr:L121 [uncultured bacterium]